MTHLDLFSGIGGFALAAQTVWGSDYRCVGFCEIDGFCQNVLRKNFEGVNIYGDIRTLSAKRLVADTEREGYVGRCSRGDRNGEWLGEGEQAGQESRSASSRCHQGVGIDLLTGGFPCQPFSTAGKRKGTQDDRFLWPEMLRVIRETKPRWVLGENVAGIINMALDQVCTDLENEGYEVQPFVIPACAVNAPHRRDRVWIVAYASSGRCERGDTMPTRENTGDRLFAEANRVSSDSEVHTIGAGLRESESEGQRGQRLGDAGCPSSDSESAGYTRREPEGNLRPGRRHPEYAFPDWSRDWREVAFESCIYRVDDGLPKRLVVLPSGERISESKWRQNALKCYGNAIVPQVAMEIMRAIKAVDEQPVLLEDWV